MENLKLLIKNLCKNLLYPKSVNISFLDSLYNLINISFSEYLDLNDILKSLENNNKIQKKTFILYNLLQKSSSKKLIYVFLLLTKKKEVKKNILENIKKIALGFDLSFDIYNLKDKFDVHNYFIIHKVYQNSLIYKKIKLELKSPVSETHLNFLIETKSLIRNFENAILNTKLDLFAFYIDIFHFFDEFQKINKINEKIKNNYFLSEKYKIELEEYKIDYNNDYNENYTNEKIYAENIINKDFIKNKKIKLYFFNNITDPIYLKYKSSLYYIYNKCTNSYIQTGSFVDKNNEFFIKNHKIIYTKIPYFINKNIVETISYIGKYTFFLKSIEKLENNLFFNNLDIKIDLSHKNSLSLLKRLLLNTNNLIYANFIEKYKIKKLLEFITFTFLFKRVDFIEMLFESFKKSKNINKRNVLSLIEDSLFYSFQNNEFNSIIDILLDESSGENSFSLICKLNYPMSIIFNDDFLLKLVSIFKFLWKLKKVEHLTLRLKSLCSNSKYFFITNKISHYVFYNVIQNINFDWKEENLALEILKNEINEKLDEIIKNLFLNEKENNLQSILEKIEISIIKLGRKEEFNDEEIKKEILNFSKFYKREIEDTIIGDIEKYI